MAMSSKKLFDSLFMSLMSIARQLGRFQVLQEFSQSLVIRWLSLVCNTVLIILPSAIAPPHHGRHIGCV